MSDPRFPNRPDHPDFWLISEVLVYNDAARDNDTVPFDDHVNQVVDLASLEYAAIQQAGMSLQLLNSPPVIARKRVEIMLAAAWMTAFQYGVRFQLLKQAKEAGEVDDAWAEHPKYSSTDWRYEVSNEDTRLGYWAWVKAKEESDG